MSDSSMSDIDTAARRAWNQIRAAHSHTKGYRPKWVPTYDSSYPEFGAIVIDEDGTCPLCFGSGKYDIDPEVPCPHCGGKGRFERRTK